MTTAKTPPKIGFIGSPSDAMSVVKTVPAWFRLTTDVRQAEVVWVSSTSWPQDVLDACSHGARLVVLDVAEPLPAALIAPLEGLPVIVCTDQTHAPAIRDFAVRVAPVRDAVTWVEYLSVANNRDPQQLLWDALVALTASGLPIDSVPVLTPATGVVADARTATGARVHLTCAYSTVCPSRTTIQAYGAFGSIEATLHQPRTAAPGFVLTVDDQGAAMAPAQFQTSRRAALGEVRSALAGGLGITTSRISDFIQIAHLFDQVVWATPPTGASPSRKEQNT